MFRFAPDKAPAPPPPDESDLPDDYSQLEADQPESEGELPVRKITDTQSSGMLSQAIVLFKDSSMGPFECQNCSHWVGDSCDIVEGVSDPKGLCNVFEPVNQTEDSDIEPDPNDPSEESENEDEPESV